MAKNDWETDDAVHTLIRAEEIKKDPKMMKKVRAAAAKKKAALTNISGTKAKKVTKRKRKKQFGARY